MKWFSKPPIFLLSVILFCGLFIEFLPEVFALAWHLQYGRTAQLGNFQFNVPIFVPAMYDDGHWNLSVGWMPRVFRSRYFGQNWALMSFSISPLYTTGDETRKNLLKPNEKFGLQITALQTIPIPGQPTSCFQQKWTRKQMSEWAKATGETEVFCVPDVDKRGLTADFMGSPALLPCFFDMLRTVKKRPA